MDRNPEKQAAIEADLQRLKSKAYTNFESKIRSGIYRTNRTLRNRNRASLEKKLTKKLDTAKTTHVTGNKRKIEKIQTLLGIMENETNVESNAVEAVAEPASEAIAEPAVAAVAPVAAEPAVPAVPLMKPVRMFKKVLPPAPEEVELGNLENLLLENDEGSPKADIDIERDKLTIIELQKQLKSCNESCKLIQKQLNVLKSSERYEFELDGNSKLIDLLEHTVLVPIPQWKDNIISLINIPNSLEGNRLKGGDYFEAFFQLAFALKLIPEIDHFVRKGGESENPVNFIYNKSVKNSGGGEHGIVDIHFTTGSSSENDECKPKYSCGIIPEPVVLDNITYYISAKNFYNEKNPANYDVDQIRNEIITKYGKTDKTYVCVACRDSKIFKKKLERMKSTRLQLSINKVFDLDTIIEFFDDFRKKFFSNIDTLDKTAIHNALPKHDKKYKEPLSLYFHQELVVSAVYERYSTLRSPTPHYTCIGVLPRGGKSYIAGGLIKKFEKPSFSVLFISSAINETISQFDSDLIKKFSDFDDYEFINLKDEVQEKPKTSGKTFRAKYSSKNKLFVFVSRELITGKDTITEDIVSTKDTLDIGKITKRLPPELKFDLIFFDEAHKGGITNKTKVALQQISSGGNAPVILLTATYKKLLSERGFINEKDDLFIWDLDDVRTMRKLAKETPDTIQNFYDGERGNKYDMFERYNEDKIKAILSRRIQLGETLESIASPYLKFPEPYFISSIFNPELNEKLQKLHTNDPLIGFSTTTLFQLKKDPDNILRDPEKFKEWYNLFLNESDITTLRAIMTPRDLGKLKDGSEIFTLDKKTEDMKFLNRIFNVTRKDGIYARPNPSTPFSMLMFLPVGTGNSLVGHSSRAFASLLYQDPFWRNKFIFVVLSSLNEGAEKKEGTSLVVALHSETKPMFVAEPGKLETIEEVDEEEDENQEGGVRELACINNGYCDITQASCSDLKSSIQRIEYEALKEGKGIVIITGKRATMGISLPCVDVVCMFDEVKEADEIIQKMYRALTDSPNKKYGFVIDLNPSRIIKAQYEYKDIKNLTRKNVDKTENAVKIMREVVNDGLFDTDALVTGEENDDVGRRDMMKTIRDDILNKMTKTALDLYEKDLEKKVPELLNFNTGTRKTLSDILSGITVEPSSDGSKILHVTVGAPPPPKPESSTSTTSRKLKTTKSEEEIIKEHMLKVPIYLKQVVNLLILRDEDILVSSPNLSELLNKYESDKVLVEGKPLDCGCETTNNLYLRVYCGMSSFIPMRTGEFLELIVPKLRVPQVFNIYNNYVESFMAALDKVPEIQKGGMSESSQKRYNSILQVIDDHLVPDKDAKDSRGEVFTPPHLIREMILGVSKSELEKGITKIWGIDDTGNFNSANKDDRIGGIPLEILSDPSKKWLDPSNGIGNFPIICYYILDYFLRDNKPITIDGKRVNFKDDDNRRKYIIEHMLYMIEIDKGNVETSKSLFKKIYPTAKPNILCADTLGVDDKKMMEVFSTSNFDIVMGNPPFNPNSMWTKFIDKFLDKTQIMIFIVPSTFTSNQTGKPIIENLKANGLKYLKYLVQSDFESINLDILYFHTDKTHSDKHIVINNHTQISYNDTIINYESKHELPIFKKIKALSHLVLYRGKNKTLDYKNPKETNNIKFNKDDTHKTRLLSRLGGGDIEYYWVKDFDKEDIEKPKIVFPRGTASWSAYNNLINLQKDIVFTTAVDEHTILSDGIMYTPIDNIEHFNTYKFYLMRSKLIRFVFLRINHLAELTKFIFEFIPDIPVKNMKTDESIYDAIGLSPVEIKYINKLFEDIKPKYKRNSKTEKKKGGSRKIHRFTRRKSRA